MARLVIASRTRALAPVAALMVVGQVAGHVALSLSAGTSAAVDAATTGAHHHTPAIPGAVSGELHLSPAMILAHALAALALAWWLHRGEALSAALARRLAHCLSEPSVTYAVACRPWCRPLAPAVLRSRYVLTPAPGRAPPSV